MSPDNLIFHYLNNQYEFVGVNEIKSWLLPKIGEQRGEISLFEENLGKSGGKELPWIRDSYGPLHLEGLFPESSFEKWEVVNGKHRLDVCFVFYFNTF